VHLHDRNWAALVFTQKPCSLYWCTRCLLTQLKAISFALPAGRPPPTGWFGLVTSLSLKTDGGTRTSESGLPRR
jgi:hypothetical protein